MVIASKGYFDIDGMFNTFPLRGYTYGDRWNGWECPYFPQREVEMMASYMRDRWEDNYMFKHSKGDAYVVITDMDEIKEYGYTLIELQENYELVKKLAWDMGIGGIELFEAKSIRISETKIVKLYPIGAYCWVWDKVA